MMNREAIFFRHRSVDVYFSLIDYKKAFDKAQHNKMIGLRLTGGGICKFVLESSKRCERRWRLPRKKYIKCSV